MSDFIVRMKGIKLPAGAEERVAKAVQSAVMAEIARLDLRDSVSFRIPNKEWLGIWLEKAGILRVPRLEIEERQL